ncbi:MAG: hypothetical protein ACTSRF_14235 [Candidatus Freyarchaeota archaeon]
MELCRTKLHEKGSKRDITVPITKLPTGIMERAGRTMWYTRFKPGIDDLPTRQGQVAV